MAISSTSRGGYGHPIATVETPPRWTPVLKRWPLLVPAGLVSFLGWRPATQGPTTCPFAIVTGVACPLCGGTRAAAALVQGDLSLAWEMHPIIFLVAPLMAYGYVHWLRTRAGHPPISARAVNLGMAVTGALLIAVWVVRGLTGTLPPV